MKCLMRLDVVISNILQHLLRSESCESVRCQPMLLICSIVIVPEKLPPGGEEPPDEDEESSDEDEPSELEP